MAATSIRETPPGVACPESVCLEAESRAAQLAGELNRWHAQLVGLTADAISSKAWFGVGIKSVEHWLMLRVGLDRGRARQVTLVARRRDELPATMRHFGAGQLSMEQVLAIARRVPSAYEEAVASLALHATVPQIVRATARYPFPADEAPCPPGASDTGSHSGAAMGLRSEATAPPVRTQPDTQGAASEAKGATDASEATEAIEASEPLAAPTDRIDMENRERDTVGADAVGSSEAAASPATFAHGEGAGAGSREPDAPPRLQMGLDEDGRFRLRYDAPAHIGALVEAALREGKDRLFHLRPDHADHADEADQIHGGQQAHKTDRARGTGGFGSCARVDETQCACGAGEFGPGARVGRADLGANLATSARSGSEPTADGPPTHGDVGDHGASDAGVGDVCAGKIDDDSADRTGSPAPGEWPAEGAGRVRAQRANEAGSPAWAEWCPEVPRPGFCGGDDLTASLRHVEGMPYQPTLADALTALCVEAVAGRSSASRRDRYRVLVHLDTEGAWLNAGPRLPGPARDALTCDGVLTPVWETQGAPTNLGRSQRIVPHRVKALIADRDRGCRAPGCPQADSSSGHVEAHHIVHWLDGGRTDLDNLVSLCPFHHDRHHEGHFAISGNPNLPDGGPGGLQFLTRGGCPITASPPAPAPSPLGLTGLTGVPVLPGALGVAGVAGVPGFNGVRGADVDLAGVPYDGPSGYPLDRSAVYFWPRHDPDTDTAA
ncbi:MAG: DUF222 domain-containing protein [Austwickia sp.]|nr:MAG: DUF222 domain-containing protein [Austwickia sp.]